MPLSSVTITGDIADQVGSDFDARRTKVYVTTNIPDGTVIDTDGNKIRLGSGSVTLNADGTFSASVWVPGTGSNPASWQTYFHVDYPDAATRGRRTRTFGPFTVTAAGDLADLVLQQEVPPTYLSTVTAQLDTYVTEAEAARDAAVDISNIDTSDGVVSALVEGTGGAGPLTRSALSASYVLRNRLVDVESYRSGNLTDRQIVAAAAADLQPGGELRFGRNVEYSFDASLTIDLTDKPGVFVNGQGSRVNGEAFTTGHVLRLAGGTGSSSTTLTAAITSRTDTLTVASTTGFQPGDLIRLVSDNEVWNPDRAATSRKREYAVLESVPNGTTLVLTEPTWDTYTLTGATVTVTRFPAMRDITVADLAAIGASATGDQSGLQCVNFIRAHMERLAASQTGIEGVAASNGVDLSIISPYVEDVRKVGVGYGVHVTDAHHVKVQGGTGHRNRHSFDVDRVRDLSYIDLTATGDTSAGISTHGDTDEVRVLGGFAKDCGGGAVFRGSNHAIDGLKIKGTRTSADSSETYLYGITLGDDGSHTWGTGLAGRRLRIRNVDIDFTGQDLSSQQAHGIYCTAALVDAEIQAHLRGFSGHGIYSKGDYVDGLKLDLDIDGSSQAGTSGVTQRHGVMLVPLHEVDGNTIRNVRARGRITNILFDGFRIHGNPTNSGNVSDNLVFDDIEIGACGNKRINFPAGYFGSRILIKADWVGASPATDPVSLGATFAAAPYVGDVGYGTTGKRTIGVGHEGGSRLRPGLYYGPHGLTGAATPTQNRLYAIPFFVARRTQIDRIGVNITTAAASSSVRVGVYADKRDAWGGYPGDLVTDTEQTLDSTSTGFKEATLTNVYLAPGLYWLAAVTQGGAPALTSVSVDTAQTVGHNASSSAAGRQAYVNDSVSGALPGTFATPASAQGTPPYVQIRVA